MSDSAGPYSPDSLAAPDASCAGDLSTLRARRAAWRARGERVVLTNGCFDLLHAGHARYLAAARALGDRLVVALNDDASVRALKGAGRPVLPLAERAELLCALRAVDGVLPFAGRRADAVIDALRPDVWAKGGDYDLEDNRPPEADLALRLGVEVRFLPFVAGRSTSAILARIRESGA